MSKFQNTPRKKAVKSAGSAAAAPKSGRNAKLKDSLASVPANPLVVAANAIPKPNTVNISGKPSYKKEDFLQLLTMLNTLKLENQYYRSENQTQRELKALVAKCAQIDPYFTAQCIVYSRCAGEGMRSINHLAAVAIAPFISGQEFSKRFYSLWDKREKKGGTIFRADDIAEIVACYSNLNSKAITNAMKKGFKDALERMDTYTLLKYKPALLDIINLVRPNPKMSKAVVPYNGKNVSVFEAIIKGYSVSADTWEVANSEAGQEVAKAVKEGKISKADASKILSEAKADNWEGLLNDGKLGILAALRNIRNILKDNPKSTTVDKLCDLLSNRNAIRNGKIMPYQIDMANEVVTGEFSSVDSRKVSQALLKGYEESLPNLAEALPGRNLVVIDMSGSMNGARIVDNNRKSKYSSTAAQKASLIAATIAKATNADVIRFGTMAEYVKYNANNDVFSMAKGMCNPNMGGTNLAYAFNLITQKDAVYDRIFILSDNECNMGNQVASYKTYVSKVANPYVYAVDLAAYGTDAIHGDKVRKYYGFGFAMFDDVATSEFNANTHFEKVKAIVI